MTKIGLVYKITLLIFLTQPVFGNIVIDTVSDNGCPPRLIFPLRMFWSLVDNSGWIILILLPPTALSWSIKGWKLFSIGFLLTLACTCTALVNVFL